MMNITENAPLNIHSTMRLGGNARYLVEAHNKDDVAQSVAWAKQHNLPVIMIGDGSNIIWQDSGFEGLVMVSKIRKFDIFNEDDSNLYVTVGAGEEWDSVVKRVVELGYSGIEQLSLIPGTAGATPIQNVGAYDREISECLVSVEAYDSQAEKFLNIPSSDCSFGYRTSRFKTTDKGRFFITSVTLHMTKTNPLPPYYSSIQQYFDDHEITTITPQVLRDAVIAVRTAKLPDPDVVANNGSFFGNPIIDSVQFNELRNIFPDIVFWELPNDQVKLSAAWLIESAGFKNFHDPETGMATWDKQALVLINEKAQSTNDLLKFKQKIVDAVQQKFGVRLEQEPELI
jgi:UDP-N-acetylmuramate dehydrogenase